MSSRKERQQVKDQFQFQSQGLTLSGEKESVAKNSSVNPHGLNYFMRTSNEPKIVLSKGNTISQDSQCVKYSETIISQQAQSNQSLSITRLSGIPEVFTQNQNQIIYKDIRNNQNWRSRSINIQLQIIKHLTEMDDKNILEGDLIKTQTISGIKSDSPQISLNDLCTVEQDIDTIAENIDSTKPITVQDLKQKVIEGQIWHSQQLYGGIAKIFSYHYKSTISQDQRQYLGDLWSSYQNYFQIRKILLDNRIVTELMEQTQSKVDVNTTTGQIKKLSDQGIQILSNFNQISLYSKNQPLQCGNNCCCFDLNKIGEYNSILKQWISDCPNRSRNVECSHDCLNNSLDPLTLRQISLLDKLQWNFSSETTDFLSKILQHKMEDILIFSKKFVEQGTTETESFNIQAQLKNFYKSQDDDSLLRQIGKEMYYLSLHNKIQQFLSPKLILRNNLISQPANKFQLLKVMDGLIYKPWRWSEKQECLRQKQKETNLKQNGREAPVFYLETHRDDDIGRDMNIIDLRQNLEQNRLFGNSQNPNCAVVTMVSAGKYFVGFYSLREISAGEPLTIDYNATYHNYMELGTTASQNQKNHKCEEKISLNPKYMRIKHQINMFTYLERTKTLFISCISNQESPQISSYTILNEKNTPVWLKNWASEIDHQIGTLENEETRVSLQRRLLFTLSKITNYNYRAENSLPPLKLVEQPKLLDMFWKNWKEPIHQYTEQSIIQEVFYILKKYNSFRQVQYSLETIVQTAQILNEYNTDQQIRITRLMLLSLAFMLLNSDHENVPFNIQGLAMILLFLSFTHTFFSPESFKGFQSETFNSLDLKSTDGQEKKCSKFCKKSYSQLYTPQFLWGEMIGWLKDHVANPQASMAQDRRGVLCYPSFIQSFDNGTKDFPWGCKSLTSYQTYIQQKFGYWAPDIQKWAYKNSHNVFGTVFFDLIIQKEKFPEDFFEQLFDSTEDYERLLMLHMMIERNFYPSSINTQDYINNLITPLIQSHLEGNRRLNPDENLNSPSILSPNQIRKTRNQRQEQEEVFLLSVEPKPKKKIRTETEIVIPPCQSIQSYSEN